MLTFSQRAWPWILAQGILAVVLGILMIASPGATLITIAIFVGVWMIIDGISMIIHAVMSSGSTAERVMLGLFGVLGVLIGGFAAWNPIATVGAFAILVAVWFIVAGVREIVLAVRIRKEITGEWFLIVSGALSVVFGLVALFLPGLALVTLIWLISVGAILFGIFMIVSAFAIRRPTKSGEEGEKCEKGEETAAA